MRILLIRPERRQAKLGRSEWRCRRSRTPRTTSDHMPPLNEGVDDVNLNWDINVTELIERRNADYRWLKLLCSTTICWKTNLHRPSTTSWVQDVDQNCRKEIATTIHCRNLRFGYQTDCKTDSVIGPTWTEVFFFGFIVLNTKRSPRANKTDSVIIVATREKPTTKHSFGTHTTTTVVCFQSYRNRKTPG